MLNITMKEADHMGSQAENLFVNLPVKDLDKTKEFFAALGFEFNPQFTNELAACMMISEHIFVMLLIEEHFKTFTKKEIADSYKSTEAIIALSVNSREKVDEIVNKALAAGGKASNDPQDHGFMYGWSFQDIDGHLWEVFFMDENAMK
jgi:predicted lactoylglutathione lyase